MTARRSGAAAVWLVARRELAERTRRTGYRWGTVGLAVLTMLVGTVVGLIERDDTAAATVAVVGQIGPEVLESIAVTGPDHPLLGDLSVLVIHFDEADDARAALRDGFVDVIVDAQASTLVWAGRTDPALHAHLATSLRAERIRERARALGIDPNELSSVLAPNQTTSETLDDGLELDPVALVTGIGSVVLLLTVITLYGNYLLAGVVEEKSTAVVEVLLAQVSARHLLAGKVLGMGGAALAQISVFLATASLALLLSGAQVSLDVVAALPTVLVWFVLGFWFYASLYAAAGSLVSRQEDAGHAAAPISAVLIGTYLIAFRIASNPDSTAATVLSIIPPLAPTLMPLRIATGSATLWQVALALALLLVSCVALLRLAGHIYSRSILHRGTKLRWRDALILR